MLNFFHNNNNTQQAHKVETMSIQRSTLCACWVNLMDKARKGPLCNLRTTQDKFSVFAQADLGLRYPLTESMDTLIYVDEQRMPRSDCINAHYDLGLQCSHMAKEPFLHVAYYSKHLGPVVQNLTNLLANVTLKFIS